MSGFILAFILGVGCGALAAVLFASILTMSSKTEISDGVEIVEVPVSANRASGFAGLGDDELVEEWFDRIEKKQAHA